MYVMMVLKTVLLVQPLPNQIFLCSVRLQHVCVPCVTLLCDTGSFVS